MSNTIFKVPGVVIGRGVEQVADASGSTRPAGSGERNGSIDPAGRRDQAEISVQATILTRAVQILREPSIRGALVGELKAAISAGDYHPDPVGVAAAIAPALREVKG